MDLLSGNSHGRSVSLPLLQNAAISIHFTNVLEREDKSASYSAALEKSVMSVFIYSIYCIYVYIKRDLQYREPSRVPYIDILKIYLFIFILRFYVASDMINLALDRKI